MDGLAPIAGDVRSGFSKPGTLVEGDLDGPATTLVENIRRIPAHLVDNTSRHVATRVEVTVSRKGEVLGAVPGMTLDITPRPAPGRSGQSGNDEPSSALTEVCTVVRSMPCRFAHSPRFFGLYFLSLRHRSNTDLSMVSLTV